jgi:hypothetical protein
LPPICSPSACASSKTQASSATLYTLTERGQALEPVIRELGRWGAPLLANAPKSDEARAHWIGLPAELYLRDGSPHDPPVQLEVRADGEPLTLFTADGAIRSRIGAPEKADATLSGPLRDVARVLLGGEPLSAARKRGVTFTGDRSVLDRIRTRAQK